MLTEGGFNCLWHPSRGGHSGWNCERARASSAAGRVVQAFTVSVHETLDLSVGGGPRGHGQNAEQQQVAEVIHPALRPAVIGDG